MSIELTTKYKPYTDEVFAAESKTSLLTNNDIDWTGAKTVKVYKVTTAPMNDYDRAGTGSNWSRYGAVAGLDATTEEFMLKKDRSFTFAIDKLDEDETAQQLAAASALARQQREVVIPEIDKYTYGVMCENAGYKPDPVTINTDTALYTEILKASEALDDAEVPDTGRVLVVTPAIYHMMKIDPYIMLNTDIAENMRLKGVIAMMDGATVVKVPANRLPKDFCFMLCHPCATVAPKKLADTNMHQNPPGISGSLVEGRFCYDAFVLENKAKAIYYQTMTTE